MTDIETAREYARRARKGLPTDRWADGKEGEAAVARGIDQLDWYLGWCVAEIERLREEKTLSGLDSMEPHADPMR